MPEDSSISIAAAMCNAGLYSWRTPFMIEVAATSVCQELSLQSPGARLFFERPRQCLDLKLEIGLLMINIGIEIDLTMEAHDPSAPAEHDGPNTPRKKIKLEAPSADIPMSETVDNTLYPTSTSELSNANSEPPPKSAAFTPVAAFLPALKSETMEAAPIAQGETLLDYVSRESVCGITEFVCPHVLGFSGVLKKRYTDFLVNEILPSGQVLHLNDMRPSSGSKSKQAVNDIPPTVRASATAETYQSESQTDEANASAPQEKEQATEISTANAVKKPENSQVGLQHSEVAKSNAEMGIQPAKTATNHSIPVSMQGFDLHDEKPGKPAPHMRGPASASTSSALPTTSNVTDTQDEEESPRKRETIRIRQTSQGWMEVDEQKDKEAKDEKDAQEPASEKPTEGSATQEEIKSEPRATEEKMEGPNVQTTPSSWQTFAEDASAEAGDSAGFQLKSEDLDLLHSHFGSDIANNVLALHDSILKAPHRRAKDHGIVESGVIDRHTRSKIHQDLRRIFDSRLESTTGAKGSMIISAMSERPTFHGRTPVDDDHNNNQHNSRGRGRNDRGRRGARNDRHEGDVRVNRQGQWAVLGGDHLHFTLCKENRDTMQSVSWLARQLNMKPSAFEFAGTKDRRGVTAQRVSVYRVFAGRMAEAARSMRGATIGDFDYQPHGLQLGELKGNEFVITLRDCDFHCPIPMDSKTMVEAAQAVVNDAIKNLARNGYVNYYGLQRFGTFSTSTDQVGVKMLQGNFEAAVGNILQFGPASLEAALDPTTSTGDKISKEDQSRALAINFFNTGNTNLALRELPRKFSAEFGIMQHLSKPNKGRDFYGAIQQISRNLRLMYVHAYQSLVWNMTASERWRRFGSTVIQGDLVLIDEHKDKTDPQVKIEDVDVDGEAIVRPAKDDRAINLDDMFTRARALSKEEAESGMYTIFDVVLPTPGFDILYPANEIGEFYEKFMASERGGGLNPHDMRRKWKDFSLSGSYRKLLARPSKDFSFDIKIYKDENEQFVETDLDRLEKAKKERTNTQHSRSAPLHDNPTHARANSNDIQPEADDPKPDLKQEVLSSSESEPGGVSLSGGPYRDYKIAVILKLQLGSSQYATIALRELLKHGGVKTFKPDFGGGR